MFENVQTQDFDFDQDKYMVGMKKLVTDGLIDFGVTREEVETADINGPKDLLAIKETLRESCQNFMTMLFKLALNYKEEKLCCLLVSCYEFNFDELLLAHCIEKNYMDILKHVWAFGKNYKHDFNYLQTDKYTYQELIEIVKEIYMEHDDSQGMMNVVKTITMWRIMADESMLQSLLFHDFDELAIANIGWYFQDMNLELLLFCLKNGNELFLIQAIRL